MKNCYVHCGFSSSPTEAENENISPPADWYTVVSESGLSFEDFVKCDDGVTVAGTLSDDEMIDSVAQKTDTNDLDDIEDSDNTTYAPWVSIKEARTALNFTDFIEQTNNTEEQEFSALYALENAIDREQPNYLKQKNTDFFNATYIFVFYL
ncbi:hypothetical protein EVAR_79778_1 [Eumeta japonica]|uniref:Uncharacterized protein n=1 Tax=Eumeta variegata TaxID=151549 RepID=A0A4C1TAF3_EUMVA|nr:hypothetical protein EVAR_79778_1 [Eumeta japonica]